MSETIKRKLEDMGEPKKDDEIDAETKKLFSCELCKIELQNEASMRQHLLGQKHKKRRSAEEDKRRVEQKCGLFIRGYPPSLDKDTLLTYFCKFGKIVWVHIEHSYSLLDYDDPASAKTVIDTTHYLGGQKLMIKYRQLRKQGPINTPNKEENNDFIETLRDVPNFYAQLHILGQHLQPPGQQLFPKYNKICQDLFQVLHKTFPYCRIHPFGSTITGLGFINSDLDVFISGIKSTSNDIPFLYRLKKLLFQSKRFTNVIVIPQAKIPILKCIHNETSISCDINLRNMLGVCNSHLINYYLNLDPKLRNVMVLLKFWARTHKLIGQNHLFTNYSLNLMLIFFLQHKPFDFPSVLTLQENPQFQNIQDGWNGGFQPLAFRSSDLYAISLLKLLEMFFSFYIEYDYGINVICPYLGTSLKKVLFNDPVQLPPCYETYRKYVDETEQPLKVQTAVCIQDPFEHSRNTTPIVSDATLETFVGFCRLGKKFCEESQGPVLYKLLTEVPPTAKCHTIIGDRWTQFNIAMRPGLKYIEEQFASNPERHAAWFRSVTIFTETVLKNFFKFEVAEISNSESKGKHKKTEGQSDVYMETMRVCFKCNCKLNLWQARKSTAKSNNSENEERKKGIMEKEAAITEQLCTLYKDISQVDDILDIELSIEFCVDPPQVAIKVMKIAAYKNSFKSFVSFFAAKLPVWFKLFEQELNENFTLQ